MQYATASFVRYEQNCINCSDHLEPEAKFCGSCGQRTVQNMVAAPHYAAPADPPVTAQAPTNLPGFAVPKAGRNEQRNAELSGELSKIMILLARERIFLYSQIIIFILINLFGCWVALKCYNDFIGDEMSKMMIASTPFLFINSLALIMIVPIKGTRAEIARLKERLSYVHFNLEFGHLNL